MAKQAALQGPSLPGLLRMPNELLYNIIADFSTSDVRPISRVNHQLYFFAQYYLTLYRYNTGLVALPNELILDIIKQLNDQEDRSHFARASQRLYPIVTNYIVRRNVRYGESSFLNHAAKRNLKVMARKILQLGGNVETRNGVHADIGPFTPLMNAAYYGHNRMVKLFIAFGASKTVNGFISPLQWALAKGHENVALTLSQRYTSATFVKGKEKTMLQLACDAQMVSLVRFLLQRPPPQDEQEKQNRSTALFDVLEQDSSDDDFVKRELHEDVFQTATMLLQHGADPNVETKSW
ncbi:hypothetical protein EK21DRAFT_48243, partial [Setomelanomma holmii]